MLIRNNSDFQVAIGRVPDLKKNCCNCSMLFSNLNTHTPEGWLRTQKEGICEDCYEDIIDNVYGEPD